MHVSIAIEFPPFTQIQRYSGKSPAIHLKGLILKEHLGWGGLFTAFTFNWNESLSSKGGWLKAADWNQILCSYLDQMKLFLSSSQIILTTTSLKNKSVEFWVKFTVRRMLKFAITWQTLPLNKIQLLNWKTWAPNQSCQNGIKHSAMHLWSCLLVKKYLLPTYSCPYLIFFDLSVLCFRLVMFCHVCLYQGQIDWLIEAYLAVQQWGWQCSLAHWCQLPEKWCPWWRRECQVCIQLLLPTIRKMFYENT